MDLKIFYLVAVFLSTFEIIFYYETTLNKTNKNFLFLCVTTLVSNFGYSMSTYATTLEAALSDSMISYIGSMLTVYFMLVVVFEMCKIHFIPGFRITLLLSILVFMVAMATTTDLNLFFAHSYIDRTNGITILKFENGPIMYLYIFYLLSVNLSAFVVIIKSIITKQKVSKVILWSLLFMMIFGTAAYLIPLFLKNRINLMPYTYIIMEAAFIIITIRANMYDLSSNLMNVYKSRGGYGYITFDLKKHYLGCDELALQIFPELEQAVVDSYIPDTYTDVIEQLHYFEDGWKWTDNIDKDFTITCNGTAAICTIHYISYKSKSIGYLFEIRDDTKQQNYIKGINDYNKALADAVNEKTKKIYDIQDSIIKGMAIMIERRDNSTGGHILRTSDCVRIFSDELLKHDEFKWCTSSFCSCLVKAAPMHDLGKIAVDDAILRKPGKFNEDEYNEMKKHTVEGSYIVHEVLKSTTDEEFKTISVNIAHYHHEKWNGEGYPEHLVAENIPIEARIMALADVFDALVSKRCYKEAKSFDEAFKIIQDDLGEHFDPLLGKIFLNCRPQLEYYYSKALNNDKS